MESYNYRNDAHASWSEICYESNLRPYWVAFRFIFPCDRFFVELERFCFSKKRWLLDYIRVLQSSITRAFVVASVQKCTVGGTRNGGRRIGAMWGMQGGLLWQPPTKPMANGGEEMRVTLPRTTSRRNVSLFPRRVKVGQQVWPSEIHSLPGRSHRLHRPCRLYNAHESCLVFVVSHFATDSVPSHVAGCTFGYFRESSVPVWVC